MAGSNLKGLKVQEKGGEYGVSDAWASWSFTAGGLLRNIYRYNWR